MVITRRSVPLFVALIVVTSLPCQAADWSLSKLNPFRKKPATTQRARATVTDEAPKWGGFPKVSLPTWGSQAKPTRQPQKPSTLAKLNQNTKAMWGKTKSVLMPWTKKSTRSSSSAQRTSSKSKPSVLTSWLHKPEERHRPQTVKDFIGQPRPGL